MSDCFFSKHFSGLDSEGTHVFKKQIYKERIKTNLVLCLRSDRELN